jgi:hypothetical protein
VYISRLVKTRDPHPGLLQFAILFRFPLPFQSAFLRLYPSLLLSLPILLSHHRLSGGHCDTSLLFIIVMLALVCEVIILILASHVQCV